MEADWEERKEREAEARVRRFAQGAQRIANGPSPHMEVIDHDPRSELARLRQRYFG